MTEALISGRQHMSIVHLRLIRLTRMLHRQANITSQPTENNPVHKQIHCQNEHTHIDTIQ